MALQPVIGLLGPSITQGAFRPVGVQSDIQYHAIAAGRLLNAPEQTGMGFWSINPYIGCAFGCPGHLPRRGCLALAYRKASPIALLAHHLPHL